MSIKFLQVPVAVAQQQRQQIVAASINEAASFLPQVLKNIIINDVVAMEQREFKEICEIFDNTKKRLSYCNNSRSCFTKKEQEVLKKMKTKNDKLWREQHYRFISEPDTIKKYVMQAHDMCIYVAELVIFGNINYIDEAIIFDPTDF